MFPISDSSCGKTELHVQLFQTIPTDQNHTTFLTTISLSVGLGTYETTPLTSILHDILNMTFAIKEYLFSTMVLKELEIKYNHIMLSNELSHEEGRESHTTIN